jgi:hypothetical protein
VPPQNCNKPPASHVTWRSCPCFPETSTPARPTNRPPPDRDRDTRSTPSPIAAREIGECSDHPDLQPPTLAGGLHPSSEFPPYQPRRTEISPGICQKPSAHPRGQPGSLIAIRPPVRSPSPAASARPCYLLPLVERFTGRLQRMEPHSQRAPRRLRPRPLPFPALRAVLPDPASPTISPPMTRRALCNVPPSGDIFFGRVDLGTRWMNLIGGQCLTFAMWLPGHIDR